MLQDKTTSKWLDKILCRLFGHVIRQGKVDNPKPT